MKSKVITHTKEDKNVGVIFHHIRPKCFIKVPYPFENISKELRIDALHDTQIRIAN